MKIPQYCSVCKAEYAMDVVPTADDDGVLWLQCPVCMGYLPKVKSSLKVEEAEKPAAEAAAEPAGEPAAAPAEADLDALDTVDLDEIAAKVPDLDVPDVEEPAKAEIPVDDPDEGLELLEAADVSAAVPYRPWKIYETGDVLHHLAWDDHGVVLDKEQLPGNRRVLKVRFAEAGLVRLIEDDGSRSA